uniref:Uncharacterized protein n=1 Tax=Leersia perrieri TaxID=77586 RepID=A0A0D9VDN7_9ORYZ
MARLLPRSRLLLALLQLAVVLWLVAASGCLCRQLSGGVPSWSIQPDGNHLPTPPPAPKGRYPPGSRRMPCPPEGC